MTRTDYIAKYSKAVIDSTRGKGLFPSVVMAQAILESANANGQPGESTLARKYNNHFGIKADKGWNGKKVNLRTGEVLKGKNYTILDYFRVYDKAEDSFADRTDFLLTNSRYKKAGVFDAPTPEAQAEALQKAGYATDPLYAMKLKILIQANNLKELDAKAQKKE